MSEYAGTKFEWQLNEEDFTLNVQANDDLRNDSPDDTWPLCYPPRGDLEDLIQGIRQERAKPKFGGSVDLSVAYVSIGQFDWSDLFDDEWNRLCMALSNTDDQDDHSKIVDLTIRVGRCCISDQQCQRLLKGLPQLESLSLDGCLRSDQAFSKTFEQLKMMKNLSCFGMYDDEHHNSHEVISRSTLTTQQSQGLIRAIRQGLPALREVRWSTSAWTNAEPTAQQLADALCQRRSIEYATFGSTSDDQNPSFISKLNREMEFYSFLNEVGRAELDNQKLKPIQEENLLLRLLDSSRSRADATFFFLVHRPSVVARLISKSWPTQESQVVDAHDRSSTSQEALMLGSLSTTVNNAKSSPDDKDEDGEWLSDHSIAMRKALRFCLKQYQQLRDTNYSHQSVDSFPPGSSQTGLAQVINHGWYDVVEITASHPKKNEQHKLTESELCNLRDWFVIQYQLANRPCLIRGLLGMQNQTFQSIVECWKTPERVRTWFQEHFIRDTETDTVPVRRQPHAGTLDGEGRATECETVHTSWDNWLAYLNREKPGDANTGHDSPKDYLKDWHFEQTWEERLQSEIYESLKGQNKASTSTPTKGSNALLPLYELPCIFDNDMLNPFLLQFAGSDYRFVYWGPLGSETSWHSDVLNSFSWSFNIMGQKEWTFEQRQFEQVKNGKNVNKGKPQSTDSFFQEAGEMVFVPSTLKHRVLNGKQETLSINRNWITWTQISQTWEILKQEMAAINLELKAWDEPSGSKNSDQPCLGANWEAHESMLRGCVGLDVTAFVLMIVVRILKLCSQENTDSKRNTLRDFEIQRLSTFLREEILAYATQDSTRSGTTFNILERLTATLGNEKLGKDAFELIEKLSTIAS